MKTHNTPQEAAPTRQTRQIYNTNIRLDENQYGSLNDFFKNNRIHDRHSLVPRQNRNSFILKISKFSYQFL